MITLFWCPQTRASRGLWMLEELGQPFETRLIDIRNAEARQDTDFKAASPMGKVPALMDSNGDEVVYVADSAPICLYLADRYPETGLAPPPDDPLRGRFLYWMNFTPGVIEPAMMEKFIGFEVSRASSGWGDWNAMLEVLQSGLSRGDWLMGHSFSAADVLVGSSIYFMKQFGILPENEVFEAYLERCLQRPAYQKALSRDGELDVTPG